MNPFVFLSDYHMIKKKKSTWLLVWKIFSLVNTSFKIDTDAKCLILCIGVFFCLLRKLFSRAGKTLCKVNSMGLFWNISVPGRGRDAINWSFKDLPKVIRSSQQNPKRKTVSSIACKYVIKNSYLCTQKANEVQGLRAWNSKLS